MIAIEKELGNRWLTLWHKLNASGNPDLPLSQLMAFYSEPNRHYHTITHIKNCLTEFDKIKGTAVDPEAVELGIWTHDAFYNPKEKDNEEKSAEWARRTLTDAKLPNPLIDKVSRLVMVSKTHEPAADDADEQMMADIDLLILGSHPIVYDAYKDGIRKEYLPVPFYLFRPGRLKVLESLKTRLDKGDLFHLPYFRYQCEETAGYNLEREIQELKKMKVAVYAGSFDPPTNGHLFIIDQASALFDNLIVAIGQNPSKREKGRFTIEDRLSMLKEITANRPNVDITSYPAQYLVNFAKSVDARYIVRGLRNEADFTAESALDEFNIGVDSKVTAVLLRTPDNLTRISSSFVMGLIGYDGWQEEVRTRVPDQVFRRIIQTY